MDSFSKNHFNNDSEPNSKLLQEIFPFIFKCGTPNSITIPDSTNAGTTITFATVSLNTSSSCNPIIKLEFSSEIATTSFSGNLNFQIFKLCANQVIPIPVGPQFIFTRNFGDTSTNTLSFFVCDCDVCVDKSCTYMTKVTTGNVTSGNAAINTAILSVLSVPNFKDDFVSCSKTHKEQCLALLRCGTPSSLTIPDSTGLGTTLALTSVTLNTSHLYKPFISVDFASTIDLINFIGILNFQVFKRCEHEVNSIPVGPQFTFRRGAFGSGAIINDTFDFSICDCDLCSSKHCTYTVMVTTATSTSGTALINSATLSAFAINAENQCH